MNAVISKEWGDPPLGVPYHPSKKGEKDQTKKPMCQVILQALKRLKERKKRSQTVFVRVLPKVYPSLSPSEQERQDRFPVALPVIFEYSQHLAICFNLFVKIFMRGLKGNISNKINNFGHERKRRRGPVGLPVVHRGLVNT